MKIRLVLALTFAACTFGARHLSAADSDFEFHAVPRRIDQAAKAGSDGGAAVTKEQWVYDLTVENKTFKELTELEVKYQIFFTKEKLGSKVAAISKRQSGSVSIPSLKSHEKKVVSTTQVELTKQHLVGAYHYVDGAKPNANDALVGVWFRVMQGGQQIAEFANPSNLAKEKWD